MTTAVYRNLAAFHFAGVEHVRRPREIHFAALEPAPSGMQNRREHVFMGGTLRPPEYDRLVTSAATIRAVMAGADS